MVADIAFVYCAVSFFMHVFFICWCPLMVTVYQIFIIFLHSDFCCSLLRGYENVLRFLSIYFRKNLHISDY